METKIYDALLEKLEAENPQKLEELTALHWFTKADSIEYDSLKCAERPDFLMVVRGRLIGVEITMAVRNLHGTHFPSKQIEQAHRDFARKLLERVKPKLHLEIGLIFNDEIPVAKSAVAKALDAVVPEIERVSENMAHHSVRRLVRDKEDFRGDTGQILSVCKEIPEFLQHIQLLNDGHKFTCVCGSRGGVLSDFTDEDLVPILLKKHKALKGYQHCDEHWLVIVAGALPPIYMPKEPPKILIPTMASAFGDLVVTMPVQSDFDRVCYFKCPTDVYQITP
ncbi:MAG: hypothetical protein KTR23_14090 [Rhodospirillales bacterium]|nr:hypothetical protein [Rhodospirillales bacterium]